MTSDLQPKSPRKRSAVELLVYILIWPVLLLVHAFVLGFDKNSPHFWQNPNSYLSSLFLDLFIIAVWYLNYYLLAPHMIRRRQFGAYLIVVGMLMLVGLFLQMALYSVFGWGTPAMPHGTQPSLYGLLMVLAAMAVGLSVRGVINWLKAEDRLLTATENLLVKDQEIADLREQIDRLSIDSVDAVPLSETVDVEPLGEEELDVAYDDLGMNRIPSSATNKEE